MSNIKLVEPGESSTVTYLDHPQYATCTVKSRRQSTPSYIASSQNRHCTIMRWQINQKSALLTGNETTGGEKTHAGRLEKASQSSLDVYMTGKVGWLSEQLDRRGIRASFWCDLIIAVLFTGRRWDIPTPGLKVTIPVDYLSTCWFSTWIILW